MENNQKTNVLGRKADKITLKGYYKNLPEPIHPKKEFIMEVAQRCNVTTATVRNWIMYGFRPENPEYVAVLSEMTGIPADSLWID